MADFYLAQNDRSPSVKATLMHLDRKTPIDLTGASVLFKMRRADGSGDLLGGACFIADPTAGVVQYDWQTPDAASPGNYRGEWVVSLATGKVVTWPHGGYVRIAVKPRLA